MLSSDGPSSHIKTITLRNLPSRYDPVTEKEGFDRFLGQLSTLQLVIWMHDKGVPGGKRHTDLSMDCLGFFAKLPTVWLTPTENISTLTLYSDDHGGYYSKVGIEKTSFPDI